MGQTKFWSQAKFCMDKGVKSSTQSAVEQYQQAPTRSQPGLNSAEKRCLLLAQPMSLGRWRNYGGKEKKTKPPAP